MLATAISTDSAISAIKEVVSSVMVGPPSIAVADHTRDFADVTAVTNGENFSQASGHKSINSRMPVDWCCGSATSLLRSVLTASKRRMPPAQALLIKLRTAISIPN